MANGTPESLQSVMRFKHIDYRGPIAPRSKEVETYNFHKAAAVLAEYGFDCIRLPADAKGADFLARHKDALITVQLKSHLIIDRKYLEYAGLYMCFPIEGTGNWYLVTHERLVEIVKENSNWLKTKAWKENGHVRKPKPNTAVKSALEKFAYRACHGDRSFRECQTQSGL